MEFRHRPVLLKECVENLKIRADGLYVDGTVGGAGHSLEIIKRLTRGGRLVGIDQDGAAVEAAARRLAPYVGRFDIIRGNYVQMPEVLSGLGIRAVDGILLDLGVSSYQLDTPGRGFSYMEDAPLDMRMDRRQDKTARDIVNGYSEYDLFRVIRDYGEERFAKNIARNIVRARKAGPVETTAQLAELVKAAIPARSRAKGGHPARRTFQAIRIECNRELEVLSEALESLAGLLNPGGRLCIVTFHSLEDRIVKARFREYESPCICPPDFPVCVCGRKSLGHVVTKKPILPSGEEIGENTRSKSAKLRVFERSADV